MTAITPFLSTADYINAGDSSEYAFQITDLSGSAIGSNDISALTLTIIDTATLAVHNSILNTSVKNTGSSGVSGTLDTAGNCVIKITGSNTAIHTSGNTFEVRELILKWTFGIDTGSHKIVFGIVG